MQWYEALTDDISMKDIYSHKELMRLLLALSKNNVGINVGTNVGTKIGKTEEDNEHN